MFGTVSLDNDLPPAFPPAGTSRRLGQKLECPLCGAVIIRVQGHICRKDSNQRHIGKIMSLNDHLCSDQDICLFAGKCFQYLLMSVLRPCSIHIHPEDARARELLFHQLLDLLRPCPESSHILGTAGRADSYLRFLMPAVMTDHPSALMRRQRNVTMRTFYYISARPARNKTCISSPVQEQHDLFSSCEPMLYQSFQPVADNGTVAFLQFFAHIFHVYFRQFSLPGARI